MQPCLVFQGQFTNLAAAIKIPHLVSAMRTQGASEEVCIVCGGGGERVGGERERERVGGKREEREGGKREREGGERRERVRKETEGQENKREGKR